MERGKEYLSRTDKGLALDRGETDVAHQKNGGLESYKGSPVLGCDVSF